MVIWNRNNQKPVINAGSITITVTINDSIGRITNNNNVMAIPLPNNIKSNGLNIPKINFPLFVLAGIKYVLFTIYHTPFYYNFVLSVSLKVESLLY